MFTKLSIRQEKLIEEFMNEANHIHNKIYDYSKFTHLDTDTPGIIVCNVHGDFLQSPHSHLSGRGCSACGRLMEYKNN